MRVRVRVRVRVRDRDRVSPNPHPTQRSTFCVCPGGDVTYNQRYFLALLAGCVPVIFGFTPTETAAPAADPAAGHAAGHAAGRGRGARAGAGVAPRRGPAVSWW